MKDAGQSVSNARSGHRRSRSVRPSSAATALPLRFTRQVPQRRRWREDAHDIRPQKERTATKTEELRVRERKKPRERRRKRADLNVVEGSSSGGWSRHGRLSLERPAEPLLDVGVDAVAAAAHPTREGGLGRGGRRRRQTELVLDEGLDLGQSTLQRQDVVRLRCVVEEEMSSISPGPRCHGARGRGAGRTRLDEVPEAPALELAPVLGPDGVVRGDDAKVQVVLIQEESSASRPAGQREKGTNLVEFGRGLGVELRDLVQAVDVHERLKLVVRFCAQDEDVSAISPGSRRRGDRRRLSSRRMRA